MGDSFLGLTVKSLENKGINYKMSFSMEGTLEVVGIYNKEDGTVWTIQLDAPSMEKYPQIYEIQEIRSQWAEHEEENPTAFNSKIYFYGDEAEMTDPLIHGKTYLFTLENIGYAFYNESDVTYTVTVKDAVEI